MGESDGMDEWSDAVGQACESRLTLAQLFDVMIKHRPEETPQEADTGLEGGDDSGDEWLDSYVRNVMLHLTP